MRKYLLLICILLYTIDSTGQSMAPKLDYITDLFYSCDSIVQYEYGSVSNEVWSIKSANDIIEGREAHTKKVIYYQNDTLKKESVYEKENGKWKYSAKVTYKINGSDIEETTTGFIGGKEISFTENYNLDYIWTTKLAPRDILSSNDAGRVLMDPKVMQKYKTEMLKITNGKVSISKNLKVFTNTEGDTIRIEKTIQNEDKSMKVIASNYLQREFENEYSFTEHGDTQIVKKRKYEYKYDDKGFWKLLNKGGYLIGREVY